MKSDETVISKVSSVRAYVLIDIQDGMVRNVVQKLRQKGIHQVDVINGPHDVIALIQGNSPSDVAVIILNEIKKMEGVTGVIVYLVTEQEMMAG